MILSPCRISIDQGSSRPRQATHKFYFLRARLILFLARLAGPRAFPAAYWPAAFLPTALAAFFPSAP